MITLQNFEIWHFDHLQPRLRSLDAMSLVGLDMKEYRARIEAIMVDNPVATFMVDEQPAAIAGAIKMWEGVATYWMLTTPLVERYKLSFHRSCKHGIVYLREAFDLHRLEASIAQSHVRSQKWAESFGFKNEGIMRGYGPDGADHYRYARVWL